MFAKSFYGIVAVTMAGIGAVLSPVSAVRAEEPTVPAVTTLDPAIMKLTTSKIKDVSATLRVTDVNWKELEKCGSDFKRSYYFKRMNLSYKYPNKVRMETKALGISALLVFNGDTRYYKVPFKSETSSVAGQPGQKQSLLQFGVFAPDYLMLDYEPHFVKADGANQVYKLTQRRSVNKSYELLWVNPKTHLIERRQSWNGDGQLTMELRYKDVKEVRPGIPLPHKIEIYNPEGKLGAVQAIENLKLNTGIDDSLFTTS